jgi:hypothetical protein
VGFTHSDHRFVDITDVPDYNVFICTACYELTVRSDAVDWMSEL